MLSRNVRDQLLNQNGFSNSGTAEQSNLSAFCIRGKQIDNLDSGLKHLNNRALILKARRITVNDPFRLIIKALASVNRLTEHIEKTTKRLLTDRNRNARSGRLNFHILAEALAGCQHNTAGNISTDQLCDFHHASSAIIIHNQGILNVWKFAILKLHIHNRSHDLNDLSLVHICLLCCHSHVTYTLCQQKLFFRFS